MEYLVNTKKRKSVAHCWDGNDTRCKMASTGGLDVKKMKVLSSNSGFRICKLCQSAGKPKKSIKRPDETVVCDYCNQPAEIVTGQLVYPHRPDLNDKYFHFCNDCDAWVGCHSDGRPLGRLANQELRRAKQRAHAAFDPKWKTKQMKRSHAYSWLAESLGIDGKDCHIGMFDVDMCERVIELCKPVPEKRPDPRFRFPVHTYTEQPDGSLLCDGPYEYQKPDWWD